MTLTEFINNQSRSISMYKGMALGLSGIWVSALVLSFFGVLSFSPLALVLSMVVLVLSTYLTSWLCAKLFGVHTHGESSLITGLILALIFFPTIQVAQLAVLAFIGMIAGASKFIITWRGRHIFNPAALAAVVIGLTGLSAAVWWVATPVLTPIVLLVVLISLYKTKVYAVPGIFLAITIPAIVIQSLQFGAGLIESLALVLSWPLLFLAGVMLTEPLTLPPRKWQMYLVAAFVAILTLVPLKIGSFQMTPALALLGGNIMAAIFAHRRAIQLRFKKRTAITPTTDEFVFSMNTPLSYVPGQYIEITLPHKKADFRGVRRSFSLTSIPGENDISLGIKFYTPSSSFKNTLHALKEGDTINATHVAGDFILPKDEACPLLLVAGGIGVTPFISHVKAMQGSSRDVVLVYAVSSPEEVAYKELLVESGIKVVIVSPEKPTNLPKNWLHSAGSRIDFVQIAEMVPDIAERWAYVSGPVPFVQSSKQTLRKLGVRSVKTDYFAGY